MRFNEWLAGEMARRSVTKRELARRLAAKHPEGVTSKTLDNSRRAVRRYLKGEQNPLAPTREAIADALGVDRDSVPSLDEEEEEDLNLALLRACQQRTRRGQISPRLQDWIDFGVRNGIFNELASTRKEQVA